MRERKRDLIGSFEGSKAGSGDAFLGLSFGKIGEMEICGKNNKGNGGGTFSPSICLFHHFISQKSNITNIDEVKFI